MYHCIFSANFIKNGVRKRNFADRATCNYAQLRQKKFSNYNSIIFYYFDL